MAKPTLNVANRCVWYPNADRTETPRAAIVTGPHPTSKNGVLNLTVFRVNALETYPVVGVRHVDDPELQENPRWAANNGGWDFPPPQLNKENNGGFLAQPRDKAKEIAKEKDKVVAALAKS